MITTITVVTGLLIGIGVGCVAFRLAKRSKVQDIALKAWDEDAIEIIAKFAQKNGFKAVTVRKKANLEKVLNNLRKEASKLTDEKFRKSIMEAVSAISISYENQGLVLALGENGGEDWTTITIVNVRESVDKLPDLFIVTSDGRYRQVDTEK